MEILRIENLHKRYKEIIAVDGLSLSIKEGICFGLLGPNGAGKTTTIEIVEGIKRPTSGRILFRGQERSKDFRQKIGIQFQSTALQDYMNVREALETFASFYDHTLPIEEVIEMCHLHAFLDQDHRKISGGQRQRMLLGMALINDPEILFLDEPTTGLDPQARKNFWGLIKKIKKQNKTVILTTHYMEEAYELCDEIAIVDKGKIIEEGNPRLLLEKNFKTKCISFPIDMQEKLAKFNWDMRESHDRIDFHTSNVNATIKQLIDHNISIENLEIHSDTLEDLFIKLTGKNIRS